MGGGARTARVMMAVVLGVAGTLVASGLLAAPASAAASKISLTVNGPTGTISLANGATGTATIMALTTEQLTVATSAGTFANNCDLQLTLLGPDSNVYAGPVCAGQQGSLAITAPTDGAYTAQFVAGASVSGQVTVAATSTGGPASITPNAAALVLHMEPNTEIKLGFTASAGDAFSLLANVGRRRNQSQITIGFVDADGNAVGGGSYAPFLDATSMPADGTYFVDIVTSSAWRGYSVATKLFRVVDQTGPILTNGVSVPVNLNTPGQNARFTFTGHVGNRVSAVLSASTHKQIRDCTLRLQRPDGTTAATTEACTYVSVYGGFLEPFTLDQAGTWSIVVDPLRAYTGTATLQRYTVVDQTGAADLSGTPVSVSLSQPGQAARFSIAGTTGQQISAYLTSAAFPSQCNPTQGYSFLLVRPNGSTKAGQLHCGTPTQTATEYIDATTLDATGTWTVVVDPVFWNTGTATLQIYNVVDQTGSANLDGTPVNVNLTAAGQNAQITFAGTSGQKVSEYLASSTFPAPCDVTVLRPNSTAFAVGSCASPSAFLDAATLDATGTWTVVVDPEGPATGTASLRVSSVVDQTGSVTPGGASVAINLPTPGQNAVLSFSGTTGDQRTVSITGSSFPGCSSMFVSFVRPNGTQRSIKGTCGATLTLGPSSLDATGTWTILVDPQAAGTGTATLQLS